MTEGTGVDFYEAGHAAALYGLGFDLGDASVVASEDHRGRTDTPIDVAVADSLDMLEYLGDDGQMFMARYLDPLRGIPPSGGSACRHRTTRINQ